MQVDNWQVGLSPVCIAVPTIPWHVAYDFAGCSPRAQQPHMPVSPILHASIRHKTLQEC